MYVDAQPVRDHLEMLVAAGLSVRQIARLAGLDRKRVTCTLVGRKDRNTGPSKMVMQGTAEKLLAVRLPTVVEADDDEPLLAIGSTRRLQALVAIGWTQTYLAQRIGMTVTNAHELFHGLQANVSARRARVVAAVYDELSAKPPSTGREWTWRSRRRAQELGWADPFAWVDHDIDDPFDTPEPMPPYRPVTRRELFDEMRELNWALWEIANKLGINYSTLLKWMNREGIPFDEAASA